MFKTIQLWRKPEDRGSWIVDRGSWIVDRGSWIVDRGSWIVDRRTSHESRVTNHESRVTSHDPRITNHESRVTSHQRGSTLVEFSLILPLLLLFTFGVVDFGRGIWIYNTLAQAAREGTRYAIVRGGMNPNPATTSDIQTVVKNQATGIDPTKLTVTTSWLPDNKPGSTVKVKVQYNFSPVTQLFGVSTIALSSTSQMTISY